MAQAMAEATERRKGPIVFLDMDQQALDDAYDQSKYASNQQQLTKRRGVLSAATRARLGEPERYAYGSDPVEGLDVYRTKAPNAPVAVFVHGGAWRTGMAKDFAVLAEMFVRAGIHLAIYDFASIDDVGGDLRVLVDQVRRATAWVYRNAAKFGGDPQRIYLTSHSSGSQLSGNVLITDWQRDFGLPPNIIKGALLSSGMYDLVPVSLSKRAEYVRFTEAIVRDLSTIRHLDRINCPLTLVHGTCETPEFQRQTRDFAAALKAAGKPVTLIVAEGYNHFEMLETLPNPYGILGRAALEMIGRAPV
jgi:arylformamidase